MGNKLSINPWTGMWIRPRETIRQIVETNPGYMYPLLCFIYGFPMALQLAQSFSLGDRFHATGIVIVCLILAIVLGGVMISITAALFKWTGKWIGGEGTYQQIRSAVAWSNMPRAVNIVIWLANLAVFGSKLFRNDFLETPFVGNELAFIFFTAFIQLVVGVWAFIIMLKALGEVQGFSAWKALLNIVIPAVLIFIAMMILSLLIPTTTNMPK